MLGQNYTTDQGVLAAALYRHAQGADDTLTSKEGERRDYHYSLADGYALLNSTRQRLTYIASISGNEAYSPYRENQQHIFLSDPYYITFFLQSFEDDIKKITNQHNQQNLMWENKPTTLILPILCGEHWCCLRITIDYSNPLNISLLWDDPYGHNSAWEAFKEFILPGLQRGLGLLTGNNNLDLSAIKPLIKPHDQQGYFPGSEYNNTYDCGPIIFSNIDSYLQNTTSTNADFFENSHLYAISPYYVEVDIGNGSSISHEDQLQDRRCSDRLAVGGISSSLPSHLLDQKKYLPNWASEYAKLKGNAALAVFHSLNKEKFNDQKVLDLIKEKNNSFSHTKNDLSRWPLSKLPFGQYRTLVDYYKLLKANDAGSQQETHRIIEMLLQHLADTKRTDSSMTDLACLVACNNLEITYKVFDHFKFSLDKGHLSDVFRAITVACETLQIEKLVDKDCPIPDVAILIELLMSLNEKFIEKNQYLTGKPQTPDMLLALIASNSLIDCLLMERANIGMARKQLLELSQKLGKNLDKMKVSFPWHYFLCKRAIEGLNGIEQQMTATDKSAHKKETLKAAGKATHAGLDAIVHGGGGIALLIGAILASVGTMGAASPLLLPAGIACVGGVYASYFDAKECIKQIKLVKKNLTATTYMPLTLFKESTRQKNILPPPSWEQFKQVFFGEGGVTASDSWKKDLDAMIVVYYLTELAHQFDVPKDFMKAMQEFFVKLYREHRTNQHVQTFILANCQQLHSAGYALFPSLKNFDCYKQLFINHGVGKKKEEKKDKLRRIRFEENMQGVQEHAMPLETIKFIPHEALHEIWFERFTSDKNIYQAWCSYSQAQAKQSVRTNELSNIKKLLNETSSNVTDQRFTSTWANHCWQALGALEKLEEEMNESKNAKKEESRDSQLKIKNTIKGEVEEAGLEMGNANNIPNDKELLQLIFQQQKEMLNSNLNYETTVEEKGKVKSLKDRMINWHFAPSGNQPAAVDQELPSSPPTPILTQFNLLSPRDSSTNESLFLIKAEEYYDSLPQEGNKHVMRMRDQLKVLLTAYEQNIQKVRKSEAGKPERDEIRNKIREIEEVRTPIGKPS